MSDEICETEAIRRMIIASAPEREEELNELWRTYSPQFNLREDATSFTMGVIFGSVVFDHKTMCQMWLLGFAAQKALHAYSPFLAYSKLFNCPLSNELLLSDVKLIQMEKDLQNLLDSILKLKSLNCVEEFTWPESIPKPYAGKPKDMDGSMVFDLICMSGAYCFLHELQHIKFKKDEADLNALEEELACDLFAREFLLSRVEDYSNLSGHRTDLVLSKRAMSIAMSAFLLFVITPKDKWCDTDTHPRIKDRIYALTSYLNINDDDNFWLYFSSLSMALIKMNELTLVPSIVENQKSYCLHLIKVLDEYI